MQQSNSEEIAGGEAEGSVLGGSMVMEGDVTWVVNTQCRAQMTCCGTVPLKPV